MKFLDLGDADQALVKLSNRERAPMVIGFTETKDGITTENLIAAPRSYTMVYGARGIGKTWVVGSIGFRIAKGAETFGSWQLGCMPWFYHSNENNPVWEHRLAGMMHEMGDLPNTHAFHLLESVDNINFGKPTAGKEYVEWFTNAYPDEDLRQARGITFDPLFRTLGSARESDNDDMRIVVANLEYIAQHLNACVLVVHHMGAGGINPRQVEKVQKSRGATVLEDGATSVIVLTGTTKDTQKKYGGLIPIHKGEHLKTMVKLQLTKNNIGPDDAMCVAYQIIAPVELVHRSAQLGETVMIRTCLIRPCPGIDPETGAQLTDDVAGSMKDQHERWQIAFLVTALHQNGPCNRAATYDHYKRLVDADWATDTKGLPRPNVGKAAMDSLIAKAELEGVIENVGTSGQGGRPKFVASEQLVIPEANTLWCFNHL